jgi:hypothetical protein
MKEKLKELIKKHTTKKRLLVYSLSVISTALYTWLNTWIWN